MKRSHWLAGSALTLALAARRVGLRRAGAARTRRCQRRRVRRGSSDYATVYPASFAPEPIPEYRPAAPGYGYTLGRRLLGLDRLRLDLEQWLLGA